MSRLLSILPITFIILLSSCSYLEPRRQSYALYTVVPGDTLNEIADFFGTPAGDIMAFNGIKDAHVIHPGKKLKIPVTEGFAKLYGDHRVSRASLRHGVQDFSHLENAISYRGSLRWPVKGGMSHISSDFGHRWSDFHEGVDFSVPIGTPVYATHAGTVMYAGYKLRGYGKIVIIKDLERRLVTLYAHNDKVLVSAGDRIDAGDKIAISGNTGKSSGPHLHYETRVITKARTLKAVNPLDFYPDAL